MTDLNVLPPAVTDLRVVALRAEHVTKTYGEGDTAVLALHDISIDFYEGQFTAIMGPSGSGKSTLLQVAAGLDAIDSGHIYINDVDIATLNDRALTKLRRDHIGFIFQTFNLVPTLNALENITLPDLLAGRTPDSAWVNRIVEMVDLTDRIKHRPSELSGGQQQRVAVARALASRPSIVFADEPTGNLDSHSGSTILNFMRKAVDDFGQTIVMVTHDVNAASQADRVIFLEDGHIVDEIEKPTVERIFEYLHKHGRP